MDRRKLSMKQLRVLRKYNQQLQPAYKALVTALNQKYYGENIATKTESNIYREFKAWTKIDVKRSFWIGRRCVDMFLPYISGESHYSNQRGLVIEVDGDFHFHQGKMLKDQSKFSGLHELRIGVVVLRNEDFKTGSSRLSRFAEKLNTLPRLDYRAKQRLMRDIYLKTILENEKLILEKDLNLSKDFILEFKGLAK